MLTLLRAYSIRIPAWCENFEISAPYVMAAEAVDNCDNLHSIFIDKNFEATARYSEELCGCVMDVKAKRKLGDSSLYRRCNDNFVDYTLKFIPFAAFANRGPSNM